MNILKKAALGAVIASSTFAVNAQVSCNGATACSGPAAELITSLFPRPEGGVLIGSATAVAGLPCTGASGGNNILLPDTHGNYKETYATLLTASVADKNVTLRIDTTETDCTLSFVRMVN